MNIYYAGIYGAPALDLVTEWTALRITAVQNFVAILNLVVVARTGEQG